MRKPKRDAYVLHALRVARTYIPVLPRAYRSSANTVCDLIEVGQVSKGLQLLKEMELRPCSGSAVYSIVRQFSAFLRKIPWKKTDIDRRSAALAAFWDSEKSCKRANKRLAHYRKFPSRGPRWRSKILFKAKDLIRNALGVLTPGKLHKIRDLSRPGGGIAQGSWSPMRTSPVYKYCATDLSVTPSAIDLAERLILSRWKWLELHATISDEGRLQIPWVVSKAARLAFVPKDGRTLRSIAIEPSVNVMMQLGVHEHFRHVLFHAAGVDIGDQTRNQELSWEGSVDGSLATLDLKSASDSVSIELVRTLLPSDWFLLLDDLRCHYIHVEGHDVISHKFSTMGNGFTFALETLIFWGLTEATRSFLQVDGKISIYGDDIICPTEVFSLLVEVLKFCGFKVNTEKSFFYGPFRESCGTDWYDGVNVTPHYLREEVLKVTDVHLLINSMAGRPGHAELSALLKDLPVMYGLENEDATTCVFIPFADAKERGLLRWNSRWQTWTFKGLGFVARSDKHAPSYWGYLAALLSGRSSLQLRGIGEIRERQLTAGVKPVGWWI